AFFVAFWVPAFAQDKLFNAAGIPIHFVDAVVGETNVLVHGYTQDLQHEWIDSGVFVNLATDDRTVAYDLLVHGKSCERSDHSPYGVQLGQDMARQIRP